MGVIYTDVSYARICLRPSSFHPKILLWFTPWVPEPCRNVSWRHMASSQALKRLNHEHLPIFVNGCDNWQIRTIIDCELWRKVTMLFYFFFKICYSRHLIIRTPVIRIFGIRTGFARSGIKVTCMNYQWIFKYPDIWYPDKISMVPTCPDNQGLTVIGKHPPEGPGICKLGDRRTSPISFWSVLPRKSVLGVIRIYMCMIGSKVTVNKPWLLVNQLQWNR